MDLVILIVILLIVVLAFRKFSSFVYCLAIVDILLRLLSFLEMNVNIPFLTECLKNHVPNSIPSILNQYSTDILNIVLVWGYVICMAIFEFYIIRIFLKKK